MYITSTNPVSLMHRWNIRFAKALQCFYPLLLIFLIWAYTHFGNSYIHEDAYDSTLRCNEWEAKDLKFNCHVRNSKSNKTSTLTLHFSSGLLWMSCTMTWEDWATCCVAPATFWITPINSLCTYRYVNGQIIHFLGKVKAGMAKTISSRANKSTTSHSARRTWWSHESDTRQDPATLCCCRRNNDIMEMVLKCHDDGIVRRYRLPVETVKHSQVKCERS